MVVRKLWNRATLKATGVIRKINESKMKDWKISQDAKRLGVSPFLVVGATAGLGIWLANNALRSKRHVQGEY